MEVTIDGIQYVPAPEVCENPAPLDVRMYVGDLDREVSLREYLHPQVSAPTGEQKGGA